MKERKTKLKINILILAFCLILIMSVGTVVAYMLDKTSSVDNLFVPGQIKIGIQETFDDNVKENVYVKSIIQSETDPDGSNIDCYIRAKVVINWINEQTGEVFGRKPIEGTDYTIIYNDENYTEDDPELQYWTNVSYPGYGDGGDTYWYYDYMVAPDGQTDPLIIRCEPIANQYIPEGYTLNVQIIAQAIQADGVTAPTQAGGSSHPAIEDAWSHAVSAGN